MITTGRERFPAAQADGLPPEATLERLALDAGDAFEIALVPASAAAEAEIDALVALARDWAAAGRAGHVPPMVMPLYGTHVAWADGRAAAVAAADRLPAMRAAIAEFANQEGALRDIERRLTAALGHVDEDAEVAFAFDERAVPRRQALAGRYSEAVSLRRRLAMLAPALQRPAAQPPTLAGQLGERLRDRTRVGDRLEHAVEQADLLERLYAACAERASEFAVSRRHQTLEWVIILLLAAEVILLAIDLLAARRP